MPTTSRKARVLLKEGKAKVVSRVPFVIELVVSTGETKQEVVAGMDTGFMYVGCAAIANGAVVYQAEVQLRNDVSKKMKRRSSYRKSRRGRKLRYRAPRFLNRGKKGSMAPSIRSKVESHLREKNSVESILPVSRWKVETASFDIHKITNPGVSGREYEGGPQKDFYNKKAYVLYRDRYKCRSGQKTKHSKKLHVHHIVFRSQGGTDVSTNLITLCADCHDALHAGEFALLGKKSKTKFATEMGIIKSQLKKIWDFEETFGYETKYKREKCLDLPKSHMNDAVAICCADGELVTPLGNMFFKRHVSGGDYRQTNGTRSEKRIPTGKLFGLRKFDLIKTSKGVGFVKGKRSSGFFSIGGIKGNSISPSVNVKHHVLRLVARSTTLLTAGGGVFTHMGEIGTSTSRIK